MKLAKPRAAKPRATKPTSTRPASAAPSSAAPSSAKAASGKASRANRPLLFREALRLELASLADSDPTSLRALARRLLAEAAEGSHALAAIKEIASRLDGPAQAGFEQPADGARLIDRIERIIVHPLVDPDDPDR